MSDFSIDWNSFKGDKTKQVQKHLQDKGNPRERKKLEKEINSGILPNNNTITDKLAKSELQNNYSQEQIDSFDLDGNKTLSLEECQKAELFGFENPFVTILGKEYNINTTTKLTLDRRITSGARLIPNRNFTPKSVRENLPKLKNLEELTIQNIEKWDELPDLSNLTNLKLVHLRDNENAEQFISSLPKSIEKLYIRGGNLTSFPEEILQFTNLDVLDLSRNQITSIPNNINQLQNLKVLHFSNNQLTSIPEGVIQLKNLEELYIFSNRISSIPDNISELQNLRHLLLSGNRIDDIPDSINNMPKLEIFEPAPGQ